MIESKSFLPSENPSSRADRIYESEDIIIKARMLETDYVNRCISLINTESLSARAKLALASVVYMAFDKNAVLANNPDIDVRALRFEEALNKAKLSYSRPDVMNPSIVYIHENLRQAFRDFVSRSYRMSERLQQGERKQVIQQNTSGNDSSAAAQIQSQQPRKHGFNLMDSLFNK